MSNDVSDEEAMRALLSSAAAREKERKEALNSSFKNRPVGDHRDGRRKRWGDNNNNSNRQNNKRTRPGDRSGSNDDKDRNDSYYGPANGRRDKDPSESKSTKEEEDDDDDKEKPPPPEQKPNFGLSGALTKDAGGGGNVYKGVVLKFREPPEARAPNTQWRFYVFKKGDEKLVETLHISKQSAYLMGRNTEIADIPMTHPSLSSQHAVLQYRALPTTTKKDGSRLLLSCQPYIMDLESTNGTFLNGVRIDSARYYQLKKGDVLKFGASTREYVLMTENTSAVK
eukprot:scaffold9704_cov113-Cylindrotheca_fusiformis.AAC.2